jgi:hypothetical protein
LSFVAVAVAPGRKIVSIRNSPLQAKRLLPERLNRGAAVWQAAAGEEFADKPDREG